MHRPIPSDERDRLRNRFTTAPEPTEEPLEWVTRESNRMFGDPAFTERWLGLPNPALNGRIPNELAKTEAGAREVWTILVRIADGVYS